MPSKPCEVCGRPRVRKGIGGWLCTTHRAENAEFERKFLLDYLWFGRTVLPHQALALYETLRAESNVDRKRSLFVSIHTVFVQECEHVGAWVRAFKLRKSKKVDLFESLLTYRPSEGYIAPHLRWITSERKFMKRLGFDTTRLNRSFPTFHLDTRAREIWDGLKYFAQEQDQRRNLYNKSKHGMIYLSAVTVLFPGIESRGPSALYGERTPTGFLKVIPSGLEYSEEQAKVIARQVAGLADVLLDLIVFFLLQVHPETERSIIDLLDQRESMLRIMDRYN